MRVHVPFAVAFFTAVLLFMPLEAASRQSDIQGCPFTAKNGATVYDFAGDVYELVGQAVSLDCKMSRNASGDSTNLMWMYNQTEIKDENVERVDNRTLRLNLVNVTVKSSGPYRCRLRDTARGVCFAKIKVGYPPLQVDNFTCTSTNWKYLVCSWAVPYNPIKTTYNLVLNDGIADRNRCEIRTMPKEPMLQFCNFSDDTDIPYPMYRPQLTFRFTAINKFGSASFEFRVDHFSRVVPSSPVELAALSSTSRMLTVTWQLASNLRRFPPGFICRVSYRSQWTPGADYSTIVLDKNVFGLNLTSLVPHSKYAVGVSCLSSVANTSDETMWSAPTWVDAQTLSDVPENPPTVVPGSFDVRQYINNRTVVIYWMGIAEEQHNGEHLHYLATARRFGEDVLTGPVAANDGTAEFKNLSLNHGYEFSLWSANENGKSDGKASLVVESSRKMPSEPSTLMVVAYDATLYEVSWTPPISQAVNVINGYTVFWTESNDRFERNPNGLLYWRRVDEATHRINITVDGRKPFYHFGVSSSSGTTAGSLLWNSCIMSYNGTIGKLKKVSVVRASATAIRVTWSLDCSEKLGIITGYKVYYCLADQQKVDNCTGLVDEVFIDGINVNSYDITNNVQPYSVYKIVVSAITKAGEGEHSDAQFVRTGETAPSTVQNVQGLDVRNSSFVVTWPAPSSPNGVIVRYNVYHSSDTTGERRSVYHVAEDSPLAAHRLNITDYVLPYANYSVSIEACTKVGCSARSNPVTVLTDIGVPGQMYPPIVRLYNRTCVLVQPEIGYDVNGPGDYWEVRAVSVDTDNGTAGELISAWTFNMSDDMVYVPVHCDSPDVEVSVSLQSRLINVKNGELLHGQWSDYAKSNGYCIIGPSASLIVGIILGSTLALTVILLFTIFATKRAKVVWYKVQNLNVKLPEGLDPTKDLPIFANGQKLNPKMNSYANLGTICSVSSTKPLIDDHRFRNDSGGTNRSSSSTDGLLLRDYNSRNHWSANDSNLVSVNQGSLSSMPSTVPTNLSSDSSMELNSSVPDSPDSVFAHGDHPLKSVLTSPTNNGVINGYNPTLTTIGESVGNNVSSRDSTPRHYSKFASYLDQDEVEANKPQSRQRNNSTGNGSSGSYVAAPYSKFAVNDVVAPRPVSAPTNLAPQAYSKFGSAVPNGIDAEYDDDDDDDDGDGDVESMTKSETAADNPGLGYSVLGLSNDRVQPMSNGYGAPSKGYVTAANLLNDDGNGSKSIVEQTTDAVEAEPNGSYVNMAAACKRSPSNTSSLTAGYSRMGLSRPTSTCSESEQYVPANPPQQPPTTRSSLSPSKCAPPSGGGGSSVASPHRQNGSSTIDETSSSPTCDDVTAAAVELKVPNGYTSVNWLVTDAAGSNC